MRELVKPQGGFYSAQLRILNPNPHGRGWISPHHFWRPVTQKALSAKTSTKINYSTENSGESMSWDMHPSKNIVLCLQTSRCVNIVIFLRTSQCVKMRANSVYHLPRRPHFPPHVWVGAEGGGASVATKKSEKLFMAKTQQKCKRSKNQPCFYQDFSYLVNYELVILI